MKKSFFPIVALCCITLFATTTQAQRNNDPSTMSRCVFDNDPASVSVPNIIKDAQSTEKIGVLPNGDMIYLCTGLQKEVDTSWSPITNGISVSSMGYCTHECILMYSNHFRRWDILTFNPSVTMVKESFIISEAHLLPSWDIAVTFSSNKQKITATWSLSKEKFLYKNTKEEELVEGVTYHTEPNFN